MSDKPLTAKRERRFLGVGFLVGCFLGLIILVGSVTAVGSLENCHRINRVYTVIQQQGERGLATLGKPGGNAFAYYQAHPAELAQAKVDLMAEIKEFDPPSCSLPF